MCKEYGSSKATRCPAVRVIEANKRITIRANDSLLAWFKRALNKAAGGN
jgi:hypothetical protein